MLEPRQVDILLLFLVLVVLPVILYILLGKWSEASNKKKRVTVLVEEAIVESFRSEVMAGPCVTSPIVIPKSSSSVVWECARCHGPATTRCSRCKSVRYCSGRCQIIHWRQGHKERCLPPDNTYSSSNPSSIKEASVKNNSCHTSSYDQFNNCSSEISGENFASACTPVTSTSEDACQVSKQERSASEKRVSRKISKRMDSRDKAAPLTSDPHLRSIPDPSREAFTRPKLRGRDLPNSEDGFSEIHGINGSMPCDKNSDRKGKLHQSPGVKSQTRDSLPNGEAGINAKGEVSGYNLPVKKVTKCSDEVLKRNKSTFDDECVNLSDSVKLAPKVARKGHGYGESVLGMGYITSPHESNGITSVGLTKTDDLKKLSKISKNATCEKNIADYKKVKVLFPFEEFVKFFELQVFDLVPRGLLNIGNSCYANAVLQCLTCTKPLVVYLLNRTHSRTCYLNNWCLMCELEHHMHMLRDASGPLSPSRILSHIRSTNCQMGDGSQEDAHEFLRLLVASMQSISLEEAGGENKVHPVLQETTFVQQTFGGRLRSMVVCLKCHHESERYENIMDLTLEIYGWVESLQDALTQFTNPEDLDGENMYRCGRCASYVRARKKLSIDEAPNILTIVLKRFQEGNYGKINKCITFPEILDMVPFMTGANDSPPLYMLYGVVVHVDTLNASFSGHYVSYVKDLQGNWFRIDDTVVQPVHVSQVMSEGAYILFYMRSFPRPPRAYIKNARKLNPAKSSRSSTSKPNKSSKIALDVHRSNVRINRAMETYINPDFRDFSDATTSDWSLFTSSDEASFTSESTRDSFSTADNSDNGNLDPFSSKFGSFSQRMVSCRMFSGNKPVTRFVSEQTGYVLDSENAVYPLDDYRARESVPPFNGGFGSENEYHNFVNYDYDSTAYDNFIQTFSNVQI